MGEAEIILFEAMDVEAENRSARKIVIIKLLVMIEQGFNNDSQFLDI